MNDDQPTDDTNGLAVSACLVGAVVLYILIVAALSTLTQ